MNMEEQNMDRAMREKLNEFSQQPPLHVWDNIQGQLQAQKRKRKIVFFSRIAAAAIVLLAFLAGWYFSEKSNRISPALTESEIQQSENSAANTELEGTMPDTKPKNTVAETQSGKQIQINSNNKNNTEAIISEKETVDLVAEVTTRQAIASEVNTELTKRESFNLNFIDKIETLFNRDEKENMSLEEEAVSVDKINREEEILIAENIRNLSSSKENDSKWKLGVQVSPGYSSQSSNYSKAYSSSMTHSEQTGNANVTGGISVQMKAGKKWSIESGVYYSQNGQHSTNSSGFRFQSVDFGYVPITDVEKSYFNTAVNLANGQLAMNSTAGVIQFSKTPVGVEVGSGLEDALDASPSPNILLTDGEFSQVFEFIEVPLYLRYSLIDAKFGVELMGGVSAGIVAGNDVYMENQYGSQNIGKTKDISTVNFSGTVGVGLNYALSRNISLAVEPRFNYYLNSVNQNPDISFRPYRIGVYTGLYYEF